MSLVVSAPRPTDPGPAGARDAGIDLIRALCVLAVVCLHALMVGVTVEPTGPVFENAATDTAWFVPLTWALQVMPLFFVIGGFAGWHALRRLRHRGGTGVHFVASRVHRLLLPAVLSVGIAGIGLAALSIAGVAPALVAVAGFRFGQPLWFLGVFLLCQALLPVLATAHERAPKRTVLVLAAAAMLIDTLRIATGLEQIGFLNLAAVWLTLQQLGFFLADGRVDSLHRRTRGVLGAIALGLLACAVVAGVYSPDLIANLNPPTGALLLVGVAQTALLSVVRHPLTALLRHSAVAVFVRFVTARTMTIYLWHMPVLLTMAGVLALVAMGGGASPPIPSSEAWWLTRPLWLVVAIALTAALAAVLGGSERRRPPTPTTSVRRAIQSVALGLAGVTVLLVFGTSVLTAAVAVGLLLSSLALSAVPRALE